MRHTPLQKRLASQVNTHSTSSQTKFSSIESIYIVKVHTDSRPTLLLLSIQIYTVPHRPQQKHITANSVHH